MSGLSHNPTPQVQDKSPIIRGDLGPNPCAAFHSCGFSMPSLAAVPLLIVEVPALLTVFSVTQFFLSVSYRRLVV